MFNLSPESLDYSLNLDSGQTGAQKTLVCPVCEYLLVSRFQTGWERLKVVFLPGIQFMLEKLQLPVTIKRSGHPNYKTKILQ